MPSRIRSLRDQYPAWLIYFLADINELNQASNRTPLFWRKSCALEGVQLTPFIVRPQGFEPWTVSLRGSYSTNWVKGALTSFCLVGKVYKILHYITRFGRDLVTDKFFQKFLRPRLICHKATWFRLSSPSGKYKTPSDKKFEGVLHCAPERDTPRTLDKLFETFHHYLKN